jgi:predicted DNA-binding transcriptional regulator AlpA
MQVTDDALPDAVLDAIAEGIWARMVGANHSPLEYDLRARLALESKILGSTRTPFGLDRLSCEETAIYLGVLAETLRDRVKRRALGIPEPYHIGRKLFWRRSDIDLWIETRRDATTPAAA